MGDMHVFNPLTPQQMKALEWLTGAQARRWKGKHGGSPTRGTLDALIRRGLAVRHSAQADLYRITPRGLDFSPLRGM